MARHNDTGNWGEQIAVDALVAEGCAIVERNWRMGHLEVDIIAMKDDVYIFAEVKTRSDADEDPLEAITPRKISNIINSARAYMTAHNVPHGVRFDVFGITGTPDDYTVEHIPDAFFPPLKTYR